MSEENGARKSRTNRNHTGEFKLAVIDRENGLVYREAEAKYQVDHSVIRKWERIFFRGRSRCPFYRAQRPFIQNILLSI